MESFSMCWAVTRIVTFQMCCKPCMGQGAPTQELSVLALGLAGSGKSTLLATLGKEDAAAVAPTEGFAIKAVRIGSHLLNIKEIGGSEVYRKYWPQYFANTDVVMFVIDGAASDEHLATSLQALQDILAAPALQAVPVWVVVSKQDKENCRSVEQVSSMLSLSDAASAAAPRRHPLQWAAVRCDRAAEAQSEFARLASGITTEGLSD